MEGELLDMLTALIGRVFILRDGMDSNSRYEIHGRFRCQQFILGLCCSVEDYADNLLAVTLVKEDDVEGKKLIMCSKCGRGWENVQEHEHCLKVWMQE